jgi:hypothetical protein
MPDESILETKQTGTDPMESQKDFLVINSIAPRNSGICLGTAIGMQFFCFHVCNLANPLRELWRVESVHIRGLRPRLRHQSEPQASNNPTPKMNARAPCLAWLKTKQAPPRGKIEHISEMMTTHTKCKIYYVKENWYVTQNKIGAGDRLELGSDQDSC